MLVVAMFRSSRFSHYSFIITSFCLFTQIAIIVRSLDYDLFESMIAQQEMGKSITATSTNPTTYSTTEGNRSDLFTSVFGFGILEYRQSVVMITSHSKKQTPLGSFAYEIPRNRLKSDKLPLFDFPAVPMIKKWFSVRPCRNCDISGYAKLPNCTERDTPVSPDPMKACNFLMTNAEIYRTLILQWDNFDRVWINFCIGPYPIENDGQNITILDLNAYPYSYESQFGCYYIFPWILYRSPTNRTLATYEETMYYTVDGSRINKLFAVINFDLGIPLDIQLRWDFHITCYGSPHRRTIYLFDSSECVNGSAYRFHWTDITTGYVGRELTYLFGYGQVIVFASSVFRNRSPLGAVTFRRFTFEQFFWTPDDSGPDNSSQPNRDSHLRLSRTSIALLAMLPVVLIIAISLVIIYCIYNGRAKPIRAAVVVAGKSSTKSRSDALAKQQQAEQQKTSMLEGNAPSNVENNSAQEVATPIMSSKISGKSKSAANQISECQNVKSKSRSQMNISRLTKLDSISNADNNSNKRKKSKKKKKKKKEIKSKSSKIGSKIKKSKKSSMRKSSQKSGVGGSQISSPNKLKMASTKSKSKKNKKVATKSGKIAGSSIRSAKKSSRQESSRIAKGTNSFRSTKALSAAFPAFSSVQQQKDSQSKCVSSKKKNKKKKKPETATSSKKKGGSKSMKKATKTSAVAGEIDPASMSFNKANTTATTISNSFKVSAKSVKKKDKKKKKEKTKKSEKKPKERAKSSKKGKPAPLSKKAISSAFPRSSNKIANNNTNTNFGKTKSKSKSMNPAISAAAKSKKNDNSKKSVKNKQKAKSKSKKK